MEVFGVEKILVFGVEKILGRKGRRAARGGGGIWRSRASELKSEIEGLRQQSIYIYIYTLYIYIYIYVYVYVCVYIYIYTHVYNYFGSGNFHKGFPCVVYECSCFHACLCMLSVFHVFSAFSLSLELYYQGCLFRSTHGLT